MLFQQMNVLGLHSTTFVATVWWILRHRNMMCLSNKIWSLDRLVINIQSVVETFKVCFSNNFQGDSSDRFIKWNNNNLFSIILNVDGGCLGSSLRVGYGGVLCNDAGFYLLDFFGYIQGSSDILHVELYVIYQSLLANKKHEYY